MLRKILFSIFLLLNADELSRVNCENVARTDSFDPNQEVNSFSIGNYKLKWTNRNQVTDFVFEVEMPEFTNHWARFSFSEDQLMVNIKIYFST